MEEDLKESEEGMNLNECLLILPVGFVQVTGRSGSTKPH